MRARYLKHLIGSQDAAVAPIVALSLFGLIAAGGIAFDYARMATLDTELQQAADQAALAAASQLDGKSGACSRAARAAVNLVANNSLFANESGGTRAVTVPLETDCDASGNVKFWQNKTKTTAADSDSNAKFVEVTVNTREAFFAFTPIVAAFRSAALSGTAFAGLESAICKVPPVMICNPNEGGDSDFTTSNYVGKGLRLVSVGNGNGAWAAGNFGYLNHQGGSNGVPGLQEDLGWISPPGDCSPETGVDTKPGGNVPVTDALNTRFDIYDSNSSCQSGGSCPPSINTVKDLLRPQNASGNNACRIHNSGWQEPSPTNHLYLPKDGDETDLTPDAMGHPRDMCHASLGSAPGHCNGNVGDGRWDRNTYFRTNYGWTPTQWQTNTGLGSTPTRYQVYQWEISHRGQVIGGKTILATRSVGTLRDHDQPICSSLQTPSYGTGIVPGGTNVDRRRISVAVVNCTANSVNGHSTNVPVQKWIDVFLVEPSLNRGSASVTQGGHTYGRSGTGAGDVYVEIIGTTTTGAGATAGQVVRHDVPYLIE